MANGKLPIDNEQAARVRKMGDLLNECRQRIDAAASAGFDVDPLDRMEQAMRARLQLLLEKYPIRMRKE